MNRRATINFIGLSPLAFLLSPSVTKNKLVNDLKNRWIKSKEYTLAVFEAMPAAHIEFHPTETQMTFAQHFIHLSFFNNFFLGFMMDKSGFTDFENVFKGDYLLKRPDEIDLFNQAYLTKRSNENNKNIVKEYLTETFDFAIETLSKIEDKALSQGKDKPKPGFLEGHSNLDMILRGEMHTAHHRAQAVVYLRLKEINPPGFR
jgi:hypothetical protein